ncbi:hypothetical protein JHK84_029301 [Glycine max]|nr:hypothetical protein JHK84_029301 [Glycine max]
MEAIADLASGVCAVEVGSGCQRWCWSLCVLVNTFDKRCFGENASASTQKHRSMGVKDKSKLMFVEDSISQEKRYLEMRMNAKMERTTKYISEISLEVDRLAGQNSMASTNEDYAPRKPQHKHSNRKRLAPIQEQPQSVSNGHHKLAPNQEQQQHKSLRHSTSKVVVTTKWETFDLYHHYFRTLPPHPHLAQQYDMCKCNLVSVNLADLKMMTARSAAIHMLMQEACNHLYKQPTKGHLKKRCSNVYELSPQRLSDKRLWRSYPHKRLMAANVMKKELSLLSTLPNIYRKQ